MDLHLLLADPSFDLPVPYGALAEVDRRAHRIRRRRYTLTLVPAVLGAVAVAVALGGNDGHRDVLYGSTHASAPHSPKLELKTFCYLPQSGSEGADEIIGTSGDPESDCAAYWRYKLGSTPPPLRAYQDEYGRVNVRPATDPLRAGAIALPPGVVQDPEALMLEESFVDFINGMESQCLDQAGATTRVNALMAPLGIHGWPVKAERTGKSDYPNPCWQAAVQPSTHSVIIAPGPNIAANTVAAAEQMAAPLRASLTHCWSLATARSKVAEAIHQSGFPQRDQDGFEVRVVNDPARRCTQVHMGGGGNVVVTLRGH